jgi:hypothetical protein
MYITAPIDAGQAIVAPAIATPSSAPRLELVAILEEAGATFAIIKFGLASRMLLVRPAELETWGAFARRLEDEGVEARHPIRGWRATVETAVQRGAA